MATPVAALIVRVAADLAELKSSVGEINNTLGSVSGVAQKLGGIIAGAFSVGAVVSFAKSIVGFASDMQDLSAQTGIGVERLQALNNVGAQSGVTVDMIADAVGQLSKRLVGGDSGAVAAVDRLGLSANALISMAPDLAFIKIAEAVAQIPNPMERSTVMMELFGRSGAKLLPIVTDELQKLVEQAEKGVIPEDTIQKLDAFDDGLTRVGQSLKVTAVEFVSFAGHITGVSRALSELSTLKTFISDGNAAEDVLNRVNKSTGILGGESLPKLTMSMKEADAIGKKLTEETLRNIKKAQEDHALAVEKSDRAYRNYVNFVEERYIQTVATQLALGEQQRQDLFRTETAFSNYLVELGETVDQELALLDRKDAAWRQHTNFIGERLMEQDALTATSVTKQVGWWDLLIGAFGNAGISYDQFTQQHKASTEQQMTGAQAMFTGVSQIFGVLGKKYKAFAIAEAIISTYLAVARALASAPWPFNLVLAAGALASGLANVSAIRNSDEPGFRQGTHGQFVDFGAGTPVTLHGRERVMTEAEGRAESGGWATLAAEQRRLSDTLERFIEGSRRSMRDEMAIAMGRFA